VNCHENAGALQLDYFVERRCEPEGLTTAGFVGRHPTERWYRTFFTISIPVSLLMIKLTPRTEYWMD
jgi:hypothetical protein